MTGIKGVILVGRTGFPRAYQNIFLLVLLLSGALLVAKVFLSPNQLAPEPTKTSAPQTGIPRTQATTEQASVRVSTDDGLKLSLGTDGSIVKLNDGSRSLPMLPVSGGFSMRMVGEEPNLLPNPSLETDADSNNIPDGWQFSGVAARPRSVVGTAHSGTRSVKITTRATANSGMFSTTVTVKPYRNYTAAAWFRSENVLPTSAWLGNPPVRVRDASPAQIKVEQLTRSGKVIDTHVAFGYTNTSGWNRQAVGIKALGKTRKLRVSGQIYKGSGTVWFDDLYVGQLISDTVRPLTSATTSGSDGKVHQHADLADEHLAFDATYTPAKDYIRLDATVSDTAKEDVSATDKAFQITYSLPVNAVGWQWDDHPRKSRVITPGVPFKLNSIQVPEPSRYPFATVHDDSSAVTVAMPLNVPRFAKLQYDSRRGLSITFDLGVSKAAKKLKGKATFTILLFKSDPSWGMRAAIKKYYDIHPQSFVRRTDPRREGFWFVRPSLEVLDNPKTPEDESTAYGLGLNMVSLGTDSTISHKVWGIDYLAWANKRNVYTSAYNHHSGFFAPRCQAEQRRCELLTYQEAIGKLRQDSVATPASLERTRLRDESQATLISASRDMNGRLRYTNYQNKFGAFNKYYQNPDPDLSDGMDWSAAAQKHQMEYAIQLARKSG
ncbi:MAG: hypothetical protein AVDCRST_MAG93-4035, partial [uncultured Chloroflexia bacterium]